MARCGMLLIVSATGWWSRSRSALSAAEECGWTRANEYAMASAIGAGVTRLAFGLRHQRMVQVQLRGAYQAIADPQSECPLRQRQLPALSRLTARVVGSCPARYASLVTTASKLGQPQGWTRGLLRCGLAAGPVFVAVFLFEGAVRDGYRPLRHPVSSLALGPRGWIQAGNFTVAGTLYLAGAAGLARASDPASSSRAAPALIGAAGAGLICSAAFTLTRSAATRRKHPMRSPSSAVLAPRTTWRRSPCSPACPPPLWSAAGGPGGPASAGSGSTARPPPSPCRPPWRWPLPASASHPGWSISAGCSSAPASSPASAGSQPCPHEHSTACPPPAAPGHQRPEPAPTFPRPPRARRAAVGGIRANRDAA